MPIADANAIAASQRAHGTSEAPRGLPRESLVAVSALRAGMALAPGTLTAIATGRLSRNTLPAVLRRRKGVPSFALSVYYSVSPGVARYRTR
jgi:hypothetical protein